MITTFSVEYIDQIIRLWNENAVKDGYKELTYESFETIFLKNPYFDSKNTFIRIDDGEVTGFACGVSGDDLARGSISGYLTCIIMAPLYRNRETFQGLLKLLENQFKSQGKQTVEVLFFNPILLPWYILGTPLHEHNNAPGAFVGSFYHHALLEEGYFERTREVAMYLDLECFSITEEILEKEKSAQALGYEVAIYDGQRHHDVEEMLKDLNNPLWEKEIMECTQKGVPFVIAAYNGKAVGFAGPLIRQPSGRGYFAGIGVNINHEGRGLGSILFFRLCQEFKNIGTSYMSLYTGKENPAKKIYLKAGFRVVQEFAVMRREL